MKYFTNSEQKYWEYYVILELLNVALLYAGSFCGAQKLNYQDSAFPNHPSGVWTNSVSCRIIVKNY